MNTKLHFLSGDTLQHTDGRIAQVIVHRDDIVWAKLARYHFIEKEDRWRTEILSEPFKIIDLSQWKPVTIAWA